MKILITGSAGFIGRALYEKLNNNQNYQIEGCDILEEKNTSDLIKLDKNFDVIYHFAATNGTKLFYKNPTEVLINNTQTSLDVCRYLKKNPQTKVVFSSTCEIFNGAIDDNIYPIPTDENVPVYFKDINNPRWSYSIPKALGENLFHNITNDNLNIRFFNIFGPNQIDHFIPEFIDRITNDKKAIIYGNDTRSFCFIDDAIDILVNLLGLKIWNQTLNIGNDEELKIDLVAKKIMRILNFDKKLIIEPAPFGSAKRRQPDLRRLKNLIGDIKYTDFNISLKKTVLSYV